MQFNSGRESTSHRNWCNFVSDHMCGSPAHVSHSYGTTSCMFCETCLFTTVEPQHLARTLPLLFETCFCHIWNAVIRLNHTCSYSLRQLKMYYSTCVTSNYVIYHYNIFHQYTEHVQLHNKRNINTILCLNTEQAY